MDKKFYIADTHFGHENIVKLDNRPFSSVEKMNTAIFGNWNRVVGKNDIVYILGDFLWQHSKEYIEFAKSLNGVKRLIKGNHDRTNGADYKGIFQVIKDYEKVDDNGRKVILSHYPMFAYDGSFRGRNLHFYGHVHTTNEGKTLERMIEEYRTEEMPMLMYNVGCMMPWMDYTPRTLDEILERTK